MLFRDMILRGSQFQFILLAFAFAFACTSPSALSRHPCCVKKSTVHEVDQFDTIAQTDLTSESSGNIVPASWYLAEIIKGEII